MRSTLVIRPLARLAILGIALLLFSACKGDQQAASVPSGASSQAVPEALRGDPDWLFPADDCPADFEARDEERISYLGNRCSGEALDGCLTKCRDEDDGDACYASALAMQEMDVEPRYAQALFLRSCRQGVISGCTNRAAGIVAERGEQDAEAVNCAVRTYYIACSVREPWGCAMYGRALIHGIGVGVDVERARRVLTAGCRYGDDHSACRFTQELLASLPPEPEAEDVSG